MYPVNKTFFYVDEKSDKGAYYIRKLDTTLILSGADFDWLHAIEQGANRCLDIDLEIKQICNGVNATDFEGLVKLNECKFLVNVCRVELATVPDDDAVCLDTLLTEEKNILDATGSKTVNIYQGSIVEDTCTATVGSPSYGYIDTCLADPSAQWVVKTHESVYNGVDWDSETVWMREELTVTCTGATPDAPDGDGWVLITDNCPTDALYARKVPTVKVKDVYDPTGTTEEIYAISLESVTNIDNGRTLEAAFDLWLSDCSLTLVSDFFDINPDATAPTNIAYTEAALKMTDVLVFQKSDVKRPDATNNATFFSMSLQDLIDSIPCNIAWAVSGSTFRLEHVSYFAQSNGIDISTKPGVINRNNYEYISQEIPYREVFKWMDDYGSPDFLGKPIKYSNECNNGEVQNYDFKLVSTDIATMIETPDRYSDSGICLVSTTLSGANYYINMGAGILESTRVFFNAAFALSKLHNYYWKHKRPQLSGNMNNSSETFLSAIRLKRQEELRMKMCCTEMALFDPSELMQTEIGWGEIEAANFDAGTNILTVTILH